MNTKQAVPASTWFAVVDAEGREWARYSYAGMAESVAERCNGDLIAMRASGYVLPCRVIESGAEQAMRQTA